MRAVVAFCILSSPVFAGNYSSEIIYDSPCDTPTMTLEQYTPLVYDADPLILYRLYLKSVEALGCEKHIDPIFYISDERKMQFVFGGADYVPTPAQVPVPMAIFNLIAGLGVLWLMKLARKLSWSPIAITTTSSSEPRL